MKISITDAETGKQIERQMTADEITEFNAQNAAYAAKLAEEEAKAAELKAIKISAYKKLGLTEAEIEALIPSLSQLSPQA